MARSRDFVWFEVNRDRMPELPKRYSVSAYPTLLFLNPADEKIHRFSAFKEIPALLAEFDEAKRRFALWREGKVWDTPDPRPEKIADAGAIAAIPAPSEEVPNGLVALGEDLLVAQGAKLYRIDAKTGEVKSSFDLPAGTLALATDGKVVYAMPGGWTAGLPISVIDAATGEVKREIVTEANKANRAHGAKGIAWRDGKLFVLEGMRGVLREVDPATGEVTGSLKTGRTWLSGLAYDGERFVTASRDHLFRIDAGTGKVVGEMPVNYRIRSIAAADGALLLMEQPVFGFDRHHERIRVWPETTLIWRWIPRNEEEENR